MTQKNKRSFALQSIILVSLIVLLMGFVNATTITVSHGADLTTAVDDAVTQKQGMNLTILNNYNLTLLGKPSYTNSTMCYLYDRDNNLMTNASFVGDICTLGGNNTLLSGRTYKILMDRLGTTYSINASLQVLPINSEGVIWNNGCFGVGICSSQNGQVDGFVNMTLLVLNNKVYDYNIYNYSQNPYEMDNSNYTVNLSSTSNNFTSANLVYNGINYAGTITNLGELNYSIKATIPSIPIGVMTRSFFWNITLNDSSTQSTISHTQNVNLSILTLCNATYPNTYLNFTFKDETTSNFITASINSLSLDYWMTDSSIRKTLSFSNSSVNPSYGFCFSPQDKLINYNYSIQYQNGSNYPAKTYTTTGNLTNTTTNKLLYLLSSGNGLYVTFQVTNLASQPISNVYVSATGGLDSESGMTDGSGSITFFLNPLITYIINASKIGYPESVSFITPTQSLYSITLGQQTISTNITDLSQGISFATNPLNSYLVNDTTYTFNYTLVSTFWNVDLFGFSLYGSNNSLLTSTSSATNGGTVSINYNVGNDSSILMKYFYTINGSSMNFTRIWNIQNSEGTEWSIANFFTDLKTYVTSGLFGLDSFGLNIIVFLIIFLITGGVSYKFGFTSPAIILGILTATLLLFDVVLNLITYPAILTRITNHPATYLITIIWIGFIIKEAYT